MPFGFTLKLTGVLQCGAFIHTVLFCVCNRSRGPAMNCSMVWHILLLFILLYYDKNNIRALLIHNQLAWYTAEQTEAFISILLEARHLEYWSVYVYLCVCWSSHMFYIILKSENVNH